MADLIVVATTGDNLELLEGIGRRLVEGRLAACCQISSPVKSIYRWDGNVETATEFELSIKTLASRFDDVVSIIQELHSYDVPQIVAVEIVKISDAYRDWILSSIDA